MSKRLLVTVAGLALASGAFAGGEGTIAENAHRGYVKTFEGTKTCLACHMNEAKAAHASIHYQWKAEAPNLASGLQDLSI